MTQIRRELTLHEDRGDRWASSYMRMVLGETYVRIATREVQASVGALMRNAGFVMRHAVRAAAHAAEELEAARDDFHRIGLHGNDGRIALALARLHTSRKRTEPARRELTASLSFLRERELPLSEEVLKLATTLDIDVSVGS